MVNNSKDRYYVKRTSSGTYQDLTTMFNGLAVLSLDGFNELGDAKNVYTEQWVNTTKEDYMVTNVDNQGNPVILRNNVDLKLNVIISRRYSNILIDEQSVFDSLVQYVCGQGDFYIKSVYANKEANVVCLKGVDPTSMKLHRGEKSYILATIELHALDVATTATPQPVGEQDLYIGFGGANLYSQNDITSLVNVQHTTFDEVGEIAHEYTIVNPSTNYLWVCCTASIEGLMSSGFEIPLSDTITQIGNFKCYRSGNAILADTMQFTIEV